MTQTQPRTFRRIPTNIDAIRFDGTQDSATAIIDWILAEGGTAKWRCSLPDTATHECNPGDPHELVIRTMDGYSPPVLPEWWVARGVAGEFYPIAPNILEQTYREFNPEIPDEAAVPPEVAGARRFYLWREYDVTGVTLADSEEPAVVAVGIQFLDGRAALRWVRGGASTVAWDSIDDLRATHCHGRSKTQIVWIDN